MGQAGSVAAAVAHQSYIERDGACVASFGNIHESHEERCRPWRALGDRTVQRRRYVRITADANDGLKQLVQENALRWAEEGRIPVRVAHQIARLGPLYWDQKDRKGEAKLVKVWTHDADDHYAFMTLLRGVPGWRPAEPDPDDDDEEKKGDARRVDVPQAGGRSRRDDAPRSQPLGTRSERARGAALECGGRREWDRIGQGVESYLEVEDEGPVDAECVREVLEALRLEAGLTASNRTPDGSRRRCAPRSSRLETMNRNGTRRRNGLSMRSRMHGGKCVRVCDNRRG